MIYLETNQDTIDEMAILAKDSNVTTIGHIHFDEKNIFNRAIHAGHKYNVTKIKEKCDILVASAVPVPPYPELLADIPDPVNDPETFALSSYPSYDSKHAVLSGTDITYVEQELPEIDYLHSVEIDGSEVKQIFDKSLTTEFELVTKASGAPDILLSISSMTDFVYRLMFGYFLRKPFFSIINKKMVGLGSRKDAFGRILNYKFWLYFKGKGFVIQGMPMDFFTGDTNLEVFQHWLTPLYRDVDGIVPEINEPQDVRQARIDLQNVLNNFNGANSLDLYDDLQTVNIPAGHTLDMFVSDYQTLEKYSGLDDNRALPSMGSVNALIVSENYIDKYETWLFLGQDDTRWLDIKTLTEFD